MIRRMMCYLNSRFPLQEYVPMTFLLFSTIFAYCISIDAPVMSIQYKGTLLPGVFLVLLSFFLLRLFDELKDWKDDLENFPDRPISKGIVDQKFIMRMSIAVIVVSLCINYFMVDDLKPDLFYLILWAWFMRVEFFCSRYLKNHIYIYLATHHFVMALTDLYVIRIYCHSAQRRFSAVFFVVILLMVCYTLILELSRKIWSRKYEILKYNTYSKVSGFETSVNLTLFFSLLAFGFSLFFSFVYLPPSLRILNMVLHILINGIYFFYAMRFKKHSESLKQYYFRDISLAYVILSMLAVHIIYAVQ